MRFEFIYTADDLRQLNSLASAFGPKLKKSSPWGLLGWIVFVGLAVTIILLLKQDSNVGTIAVRQPRTNAAPVDWTTTVMPLIPWILIFFFIWFFVFRKLKQAYVKQIADNPAMQMAHAIEFTDDGVSSDVPNCKTSWTWEAFSKFVVTDELVALTLVGFANQYVIVPRRAIRDDQFEPLRSLLQQKIHPQISAFPVITRETHQ